MLRVFGVRGLLRRAQFFDDRLHDVDLNARHALFLPEATALGPGLGLGIEDVPGAPIARPGVPNIEVSGQIITPDRRRRTSNTLR
jgi:hypothetical protein